MDCVFLHTSSSFTDRLPDIVHFTFLGSGHFFVFLQIFSDFVTSKVKLSGNSLILLSLAFMSGQCIPHYWGNTHLSTPPIAPQIMSLFQSGRWEQALFPVLCEHEALFLSLASGSFLICTHWLIFCQTLQANLQQILGILSMQHSPMILSANSSCFGSTLFHLLN